MKKRMWIFILVIALLATGLLPAGILVGNIQSGGKLWENAWSEHQETGKQYGSDDVATDTGLVEKSAVSATPILTLKAPTLEFKDMITVNAMFTAENIEDVVEMGMITYSSKVAAWSVETAEHVIPGTTYDEGTGRYIACSQGIHAKYLGDTVYLATYAKLTDGSYVYSKLAGYSPVQYAVSKLKGADVPLKQLVVAMLNYGAAAQTHFNHNVANLANATLTAEQIAMPESYRSDMVSAVASPSAAKQGEFANNKGFAKRYPSISFEGAFCINYFFTPNYAPDNGITLYYWNAVDYQAASVLSIANASGSLKLEGKGTTEYRGDITGIAAKALSEATYVAAVYESNGTTWTSGVLGYSIGAYCASQSTKAGTIADLAKMTAVYGYHALLYFGAQSTDHTVHPYATEWSYDETQHWHDVTCEHYDMASDFAEHSFVNHRCSVCNAMELVMVTFMDFNGMIIDIQQIPYGTAATAPAQLPEYTGYAFDSWDRSFDAVTEELVVTARYIKCYTVTFLDYDGTELKRESVKAGESATEYHFVPSDLPPEGYRRTGWDKAFDNVTEDITVRATYEKMKYTVKFYMPDGSLIAEQVVEHGADAEEPSYSDCYFNWDTYRMGGFSGWSEPLKKITGNTKIYADYQNDYQQPVISIDTAGDGASAKLYLPRGYYIYTIDFGFRWTGDISIEKITKNSASVLYKDKDGSAIDYSNKYNNFYYQWVNAAGVTISEEANYISIVDIDFAVDGQISVNKDRLTLFGDGVISYGTQEKANADDLETITPIIVVR